MTTTPSVGLRPGANRGLLADVGWRFGFAGSVGLSIALAAGCGSSGQGASDTVGPADCPVMTAAARLPATVEEANAQKATGAHWTNKEVRGRYVCWVTGIAALNEGWKREGLSAEERAKRAFQARHEARLTSRAMMASASDVEVLRARDQEKYGNPDGPTFEWLVEKAKEKGLTGDAVFEEIVASAQRTDAATNKAFGLE